MLDYTYYRNYLQQLDWRADFNELPESKREWLMITGSLTAALQQKYDILTVMPIYEGWITSTESSDITKGFPEQSYWLREVLLIGNGKPLIFARTEIPPTTFQRYQEQIKQLGATPIGKWLFDNEQMIVRANLMWGSNDAITYARRSILMLENNPFIISELFLDDFWGKA